MLIFYSHLAYYYSPKMNKRLIPKVFVVLRAKQIWWHYLGAADAALASWHQAEGWLLAAYCCRHYFFPFCSSASLTCTVVVFVDSKKLNCFLIFFKWVSIMDQMIPIMCCKDEHQTYNGVKLWVIVSRNWMCISAV